MIDREALISVEREPSAKIVNSSENRVVRISTLQKQMSQLGEELKLTKDQLDAAAEERDRALDELRESKMVAHEANMRLSEALSPKKAGQVLAELKAMKESLSNSQKELTIKEKDIEAMKVELEQAKHIEIRDSSIDRLNEELRKVKASETRAMDLFSQSKKRIEELETEMERGKLSESKMLKSVGLQTQQLEETKIALEESKLEIASLREKMEKLQNSSPVSRREVNGFLGNERIDSADEAYENLKSELQQAKENLARVQESEKAASLKANDLLTEIGVLKNELKAAMDGEEKSTKALDDLALALKEVATQANQAKEKLSSTEIELEHLKGEAEQLKVILRSNEERYKKLLDEAKKEAELHKNTGDRLRLEAEESLLAWNGKEMGFVSVIRKVEEEKAHALHENGRLTESLKSAEKSTMSAREDNHKLRDILKQALNESNVAKEAASIAREENSQLKDSLADKDDALHFLTRENERLRINEAAANERMKELKRLLAATYAELKTEDKEENATFLSPESAFEEINEENALKKGFSFDLNEIKLLSKHEDVDEKLVDEDPVKAEALKGSIFDPSTESPKSEPHTPKPPSHHRRKSSALTDYADTMSSEDFEQIDGSNLEDSSDSERNSHRRRRSALFKRFGDLIMRKSFHKTEPPAAIIDQ